MQQGEVTEDDFRLDLFLKKISESDWLDVQAGYERGLVGFFGLSGQEVALGWEKI